MSKELERNPTIDDLKNLGFYQKDGALFKYNFNGCIQFWDGRWFHADERIFKTEIETIDKLNNIIIENTIS